MIDTRAIQDWLGHRSIQHTVRYTELSPTSSPIRDRDEGHVHRLALSFRILHQRDQALTEFSPLQNLSKSNRGLFLKIGIAVLSMPRTQGSEPGGQSRG